MLPLGAPTTSILAELSIDNDDPKLAKFTGLGLVIVCVNAYTGNSNNVQALPNPGDSCNLDNGVVAAIFLAEIVMMEMEVL